MTDDRLVRSPHGFYAVREDIRIQAGAEFYREGYYEELAPTDRRFTESPDAEAELEWKRKTVHADWIAILREMGAGPRVLDIGAGLGELAESLMLAGFDALGVEPSASATAHAQAHGRPVRQGTLEALCQEPAQASAFDVVCLTNVLEHLPDAEAALQGVRGLLKPGGIALVRVPNDFTALQEDARRAVNQGEWWVSIPHHLYYFDYGSLAALLAANGLREERRIADFPVELFLLMGEDYTRDALTGKAMHARRRKMDAALSPSTRRALYEALAQAGQGRNATIFARLES